MSWRGRATVVAGERLLDLTVQTRIEPFARARSTSWITRDGEASARTLVIEPETGWLERGGRREALPDALIRHERQQYGVYGYLLGLAPSHDSAEVRRAAYPGFPPISMTRAGDGRITRADYVVDPVEGTRRIHETFGFSGTCRSRGVRWFRTMTIDQDGKRFFTLAIDRFEAIPG